MLSQGEPRVDNVYSLSEGEYAHGISPIGLGLGHQVLISGMLGILRLHLNRETYERAGLQGKAIQSGGRKHVKARYCTFPPKCSHFRPY